MNTIKNILMLAFVLIFTSGVSAQTQNPVISAIQKEVDRNMAELRLDGMAPPFFVCYSVLDMNFYSLNASLGTIINEQDFNIRRGVPRLFVGDYMRNTAKVTAARTFPMAVTSLHDNATGVPITIWRGLDDMYKDAAERYKAYLATLSQRTQTPEEAELPDFQRMEPVNMLLQPKNVNIDKPYWENYLRKASEVAKQYPEILSSSVSLLVRNVMTYTYNTEGSRYAFPNTFYQLRILVNVRADDGQDINYTVWIENSTFEQMPDLAAFTEICKKTMENLVAFSKAPVIDIGYNGPVLFEGEGVSDIFRRAFFMNNRLVASPRMTQPNPTAQQAQGQAGNDFELSMGRRVMSRSITVKSITGQEFHNGQRLNGYYPIDSEGIVPDKELMLIEDGVLRNLLSGRRPTQRVQSSNGHTRFDFNSNQWQVMPGNILINSRDTYSNDELRKQLIEAAKDEDLDYAYVVRRYFFGINLFYRVYVEDGREELVRGAMISDDTNLRPFNRILGASDKERISSFSEMQSSIIYPDAMLFEEMQITRMPNIQFRRPYIVPKPTN